MTSSQTSTVEAQGSDASTPFWVVGVDGSECAEHAAEWATQHATGRVELLKFVTAWTVPNAPALPPIGPMAKYWDLDAFAQSATDQAAASATAAGQRTDVRIESAAVQGQGASVLTSQADDAELLVIGSRGNGGFKRLLLGSTSTQCATHAVVPTAVIPCSATIGEIGRIVVAVDGSDNSLAAASWALQFAPRDAVVELVNVWDVAPIAVGADQFFFPEAIDLAEEQFGQQVAELRAIVGDGVDIRSTFTRGNPRTDLEIAAERADLFVMGARGHGAVGAALLGSISTWLLHHLSCPMVVVPADDPPG
ncbi:universal stress protein [Ilumatobacter coccineus]|uniref:UspA domain-containing protein n=1 Tax=Ilumatobacter coccineus (strain NBRC 103263 / KCTC 29153 / YM16-304) TaxID=1313172 RepID=A0A6C7EEW4_ILUCY|nr:universal stress protein [Ilumatobacter coccineus]BAN03158.1 hypothetical protein YM304_28440 [Ilumatobacter coccineus YM16-304]